MLLSRAIDIFQILLDKYGSPNVIDQEVIDYLNMGTQEYLNRLFPDTEGGRINFEFDENVVMNIQPLIYKLSGLSPTAGIVTNGTINTALQTETGDPSSTYFRIASIGYNNLPVKYMKHNNRWAYQENSFKEPTVSNPKYTILAQGIDVYPTSLTNLTVTVIKAPIVWEDGDQSEELEFDDYVTYSIIGIALKLAYVSLRDVEGVEVDARLADLQITK